MADINRDVDFIDDVNKDDDHEKKNLREHIKHKLAVIILFNKRAKHEAANSPKEDAPAKKGKGALSGG